MEDRMYYGLNKEYNCDINLCVEDIGNLKDYLVKIKDLKLDFGVDFFPFTIQYIIKEWEDKIGKSAEECMK